MINLKNPLEYRADGRESIFPSEASLGWFVRKNKARLVERGAILAPTGRKLINPEVFDQVVLEIGTEAVTGHFR